MPKISGVNYERRESPILLLDDVMSELDENRQQYLVQSIEKHQTIITCTGVEDSIRKMNQARIFRVTEGRVES